MLHVNLTVQIVDPTAGNPGAGESDPPGDAQQFPSNFRVISKEKVTAWQQFKLMVVTKVNLR